MVKCYAKRCLSFLLALLMCVSMLPVQARAEEAHEHDHAEGTESVAEAETADNAQETLPEEDAVRQVQAQIDAILDRFKITEDLTDEQIADHAIDAEEEDVRITQEEILLLEQDAAFLTEVQFAALERVELFSDFMSVFEELYTVNAVASQTVTVLDGQVEITDSRGTGSASGDTVTITVKAGDWGFWGKTNDITITNATGKKIKIGFNYSASNASELTIAGNTANSSGTYKSDWLDADGTISVTLGAAKSKTATLTLNSFSVEIEQEESQVTFAYDAEGGSVTVAGSAVANGDSQKISLTDGVALVATAKTDYTFLGWIDEDNRILSQEATYTLTPLKDMTVTAVFAKDGGEPWFALGYSEKKSGKPENDSGFFSTSVTYYQVEATYLYRGLTEAAQAAQTSGTDKTLVLMNNATLSAGDYTIPVGVTLLIPFDANNTLYTTAALSKYIGEYSTPKAYRTLTMAEGANLTVNGALSLSARHTPANGGSSIGGTPSGNMSFVKMEANSNITVNNGGALYAYGYVIGDGTVTANSGSKVYELFQFTDFRGGSASTKMENGVFPLSQYYIQNIEVPMTIYSGATEYAYTTVYMSGSHIGSAVGFIASKDAMFNLTDGYAIKRYDAATDRLIVEGYGSLKLSSIKMQVGTSSINSKNYELPINSNITVHIHTGNITVNQDVALLPGAKVTIDQGATCTLGSGVSLYVYDADEWGGYCGSYNYKLIPLGYVPDRTCTRTEADLVDAKVEVNGTLDASAGYLYTTTGGADICGTGTIKMQPGNQEKTHQAVQTATEIVYTEIPITSAQLHNADGTYTQTTEAGEYSIINGIWSNACKHTNTETVTGHAATCTEDGLTDGVKCSDCGEWITEQQVITAPGHDWADATCTTPKTCKTCQATEGEALGHDWADATCTTPKTCKTCQATEGEALGHDWADATCTTPKTCKTCQVTEGEALGHDWADATCTEPKTCKTCKTTEGEALGHDWADATCTTPKTCKTCQVTEGVALGHDWADATCTEPKTCKTCKITEGVANGHKRSNNALCSEDAVCTICGAQLPASANHQYKDTVTEPTCTAQGYTTHVCLNCGHTYVDSYAEPDGHQYTDVVTEPTCTEKGYTTHTCHCGDTYVDSYVKPDGHQYTDVVTEPTCTEKGYTTHTCHCGDTYVDSYVDPNGHSYVPTVTEPTCTEQGYTTYTCHCSDTYVSDYVDAKGHTPSKDAKCAEDVECTICHAPIAPTEDHDYEEETVAPTCTEAGYTRHTCKNCGKTYDDNTVAVLGHDPIFEEEYPATCTEDGHTAGTYCSRCDYVTWDVLPAPGHDWVDVDAKIPTYTNVGWNAHKQCSVCKEKEGYEEIPVLDEPVIDNFDDFVTNLELLEELAHLYTLENPGVDPLNLVIKYIRTGVERYNSGSWGIMAGYEDSGFAKYVNKMVDEINSTAESEDQLLKVVGLKNIEEFDLPNGDHVDFGHMFGTMDITYHNNGSQNHADVAGWGGDITDLLSAADRHNVTGTLEEMVTEIRNNILCKSFEGESDTFSQEDMYGDLDGLYLMNTIGAEEYEAGMLTSIMKEYFTESLSMKNRADYFLRNRLGGASLREQIRTAVYNAYTGNKVIATLEGTREFTSSDLTLLRKACCYAFADYMCELAGDYVEVIENPYYDIFSSTETTLAPGITQQIKYATTADGKQIVYYVATADITRSDVQVYANYNNNDPASGWAMQRVLDQANAAQDKYGDPESEYYIPNYNVIASVNGSGYNMSTGEPSGLLVMGGVEYHAIDANGFFGILKDGTPVIGTMQEYNTVYKDQVQEGIQIFGTTLIRDGKISVTASSSYYTDRASRTAVGITATGKVVMMVLDGRQEPFSCGGSMQEIAQIMFEAGCVEAVNLDGGGSTTYVAKQPGEDSLKVVSRPSDGAARSVSTSLMMVSTAPSSTAFDHAQIKADYNFMTVGATVRMTATGISATGDAAQIPEGAYWAVSDESKATITEDGVLTAKKLGSVTVNLMLDQTQIGSAEIEIVNPNNVYFTKKSINAVYGQSVDLPVKALYDGKEVAIVADDLIFTCSNTAGMVSGFSFVANSESSFKNVKITAALSGNENVSASITVALYNQGEVSFDFDQATGGDRQMAWDRVVTNATSDNAITYEVIDPEQPMVTNYSFALDMTQIPIPEQLNDLLYMLPGSDAADASAWGFLLQLAERISTLTEVKTSIQFDPNVTVDYSGMKLVNEYFTLTNTEFDEQTNTLTLTLNWIKQTAAIDVETADPLCIVSGIKITPKDDAAWTAKNTLTIANSGSISYQVYMRAGALYSFAQKEENQKTYDLMPYENPNDGGDKGGCFGSVYCTFSDSYTLVNALKNGWYVEDGGYAYYEDGEKYTGIHLVDGAYYDFGENGINAGQTKYNGVFFDEEAKVYRYSYLGTLASGWQSVDGEWYYYSSSTMAAVSGHKKVGDVYYDFEENGKLVSGVWANTLKGTRYYYGPAYHYSEWLEVDGEMYYFDHGYRLTGYNKVKSIGNKSIWKWYYFGDDGIAREINDGLIVIEDQLYYMVGGINQVGLQKVNGDYYFFTYAGPAICSQSYYAWETHCDLPCSTYAFGADGKMVNGLAEMSDGVYYYVNGKVVSNAAGLTKIGDDYYFVSTKGRVATGSYYAWATNCDLPCGNYEFGADGKMLQGIVEKENGTYFYVNGKVSGNNAGLTKIGDDYYFVASNGRCATGNYYCWATNCDLPVGNYEFGSDGKMLQGIIEKDGSTYFYVNGRLNGSNAGLTKVGDDYYFVASNGKCATGSYYAWATNCDLPCGEYEFGSDGKMLQGIVEKDGYTYYYVLGKLGGSHAGLTKVGDDYYFVASNGKCATGTYYAWATNCDLPCGEYEFGSDGKMLHGLVEKEDGLYCYVNGKMGGVAGLNKIGDDYYFVTSSGKCVTGKYYAWATNCDLPVGNYEFGADGKMLNGFVTVDSAIYYYELGKVASVGLHYIDGNYYFVTGSGKLVTNQSYYVWETNGLLLEKTYTFDEFGRIIG